MTLGDMLSLKGVYCIILGVLYEALNGRVGFFVEDSTFLGGLVGLKAKTLANFLTPFLQGFGFGFYALIFLRA